MATGFTQRFKGKIAVVWGGIWQSGVQSSAIFHNAGAPTDGTSGTLVGLAPPGALVLDTTNGNLYQNTNTLASPTWSIFQSSGDAGSFTTVTASGLVTAGQAKVDTGTKTAAASAGAATLNKNAGRITSEALTTAGLADYTLTLTNSQIAAADQVLVNVGNGTNTQGDAVVGTVTPAAGSVVIIIRNAHATQALNGTLIVSFVVFKN